MAEQKIEDILVAKVAMKLAEIRKREKLSQYTVANDLQISINRIERNMMDIRLSTFFRICDYYDISPKEFFEGLETE